MAFILEHFNDPQDGPCVIWPYGTFSDGYGSVTVDGRNRKAHHVALELREGPAPAGHEACHGPCNNRRCLIHTYWGTRKQNADDRSRDGTQPRGELHVMSKLTEVDVRTIRVMLADGVRQRTIAEWFKVARSTVASIAQGKSWAPHAQHDG